MSIFGIYVVWKKSIPFVDQHYQWSIGIYSSVDGLHYIPCEGIRNPVLTLKDVSDIKARFVADPFMVKEGNRWYMFFEMYNASTKKGDIGLAESEDGLHWHYAKRVLEEPFHLSYPFVFKFHDRYYMVPETSSDSSVRLYEAVDFPYRWRFLRTLFHGAPYRDVTLYFHENKWWFFASDLTKTGNILYLYFADSLEGAWEAHPKSPLYVDDWSKGRQGGRIVSVQGKIIRFAQDGYPYYGKRIRTFEIVKLNPHEYEEVEIPDTPVSASLPQERWHRKGIHHIDPHFIGDDHWLACVDGFRYTYFFGRGRRMDLKFKAKGKT